MNIAWNGSSRLRGQEGPPGVNGKLNQWKRPWL